MALDRADVSTGLLDELDRFAALVRPLSEAEWEKPSRCEGWTVGDVARHVVGSMADVVAGRLDGLGTPEVTEREVAERAGRSPAELADECVAVRTATEAMLPLFDDVTWDAPAPGGYEGTLGDGVEALWYDTWLHADDIRAALGRPTEVSSGLRGSLSHLRLELDKRGWQGTVPDAADEDAAVAFVLAATGRAPATGPDGPIDVYAS
jgi:uncharacterized protein (TIGR03083 family)